ncbi:transcriptional repressor [Helcobacillus massiliensis]|uniref:Fur family transcriptional regulator n=1 Tax=Helcobacillus massiliensis TaxID=521392 RepID=UPI0021A8E581|nr:Fur family transcriptional regulator [Helcobacillus massiliensis]MCT1557154.1 transcriptional repressor [Helcobacillus massiliensis]MCT2036111.1 transcriptional repressor [Helcobacillus massiliensis]MCT2331242.1 transcriptional repressor [Helcobacillus massiliensis]
MTKVVRQTRQRTAILNCLATERDFMTAQQLYDLLRDDDQPVGLATVYRNLQSLVDAGLVDVLITDEGEAIYRQCRIEEHHHHLLCRVCGHTIEFVAPELERWAHRIAQENGFTDLHHTMEIYGLCPKHQESAEPTGDAAASAEQSG